MIIWPAKSQTERRFPLFNYFITARKTSCNSIHWADLFLPPSIWLAAFQKGSCPFTLELSPTNKVVLSQWGLYTGHCQCDNRCQKLPHSTRVSPRGGGKSPQLVNISFCVPQEAWPCINTSFYYGTLLGTDVSIRAFLQHHHRCYGYFRF